MIYERAITLLSGRYGGRAAPQAYLEFAQEHFLAWMATEGLFDGDHPLIFKGGTALRKFTFGLAGRFSTDLDFAAENVDYPEHVLDSLAEGFALLQRADLRTRLRSCALLPLRAERDCYESAVAI